ncbi:MAG: nucleoside-diphosphate sugar epimerase [Anaerolineaceae bacterium 4572_78]|nr:MAG: nucleoside-diphosphate sugar epimerase [Anaerolineaceae bacterium 4572_78]
MKMLVTGGAGFIGSHLNEYLLEAGHHVTAVDNVSTGHLSNIKHLLDNDKFHFVQDTIMNQPVIDDLVSRCDIIFHLAAAVGVEFIIRSPVNTIETNVFGTEVILQTAHRYHKKVLIASTSEVYGKGVKVPFHENDDRLLGATTKSRWSYAASKAIDEFLALAYYRERNLPVVIFRLFNTVGPRQTGRYGMVIPRFVKQALDNQPVSVYGTGKQSRCFCDVTDVIRAIVALAETPEALGEVYNIGSTEEITIADLATKIIDLTNSQSAVQHISYDKAYEPGFEDMRRRVPSIDKINHLIGWQPTYSLTEILERIVSWSRS